jgi:hypothetical protein
MTFQAERYKPTSQDEWNSFVASSKNGTFLLDRRFMDYHSDRFADHSVMIRESGALVAVLPANFSGEKVSSHDGLTYGGLLFGDGITLVRALECFREMTRYYRAQGLSELIYKQPPNFYFRQLAFEDEYALFLAGAQLFRRDTSFVIDLTRPLPFQERRERSIKKAAKSGLVIAEEEDFTPFWNEVLVPNLQERFGVAPVHSLSEITLLASRWKKNIRLHTARLGGKIVAGTVIFDTPTAAHAQYISANEEGRNCGALDLLYSELIRNTYAKHRYFSFGIANEEQGRKLNTGLIEWKEGFGARAVSSG